MDQRLRALRRLVDSDPNNIEYLYSYIRALEQVTGAGSGESSPTADEIMAHMILTTDIASQVFNTLKFFDVGLDELHVEQNWMFTQDSWQITIADLRYQKMTLDLECALSVEDLCSVQNPKSQPISAMIRLDVHLHSTSRGSCGNNCGRVFQLSLQQLTGVMVESGKRIDDVVASYLVDPANWGLQTMASQKVENWDQLLPTVMNLWSKHARKRELNVEQIRQETRQIFQSV